MCCLVSVIYIYIYRERENRKPARPRKRVDLPRLNISDANNHKKSTK